ncbi:hypothetical protein Amet_3528 [Alkaliphilus metalliredigens QYMF]|uniref:CobQ/CobB/MinD/ParA nucleotide binding domain-containing protein n=1 Tax=Alkaliphilus metalliredigens (strain QYMF) TaxID=293826 RepID=A6TTY6_ALKMQ|nr:hypothetical protein [Alkaliphilus metalliredigens]ABR49654.1 hypothetical protein Amet_3528 [Alkaliphilus metalliredigens QYMF]
MDATTNEHIDGLQRCIITTGVSSLNYEKEHMQSFEKNNSLLYNCMRVSSIKNIDKVDEYKVIIDFCDNNLQEIVFELLNHLLAFNVEIHVKVINNIALSSDEIEQCMILLNRLDKHKLIHLEIINKSSGLPKEEGHSWIKKLKNAFFFTGSGNTGKTSLISALSELCNEKKQTVALIDLTEHHKLVNYFTSIYPLIGTNHQDHFVRERIKHNKEDVVNVYTYNDKKLINSADERVFYEAIKKISSLYDYVFVNTDINIVNTKSNIFNMGEKVLLYMTLCQQK